MSRSLKVLLIAGFLLAVVAAGSWAVDSSQRRTIAAGVTVGGVDVGGMEGDAARAKVKAAFAPRLRRPVIVTAAGQKFELTPRRAGVRIDYDGAVEQAIATSRRGWIGSRLWRSASGSKVDSSITPGVRVDSNAVDGFSHRIAKRVNRPPVEAHLLFGPDSVTPAKGSPGYRVSTGALSSSIAAGLTSPAGNGPVRIAAPLRTVQPKSTTANLSSQYPTVITVSRAARRLYLFKDLKLVRTFPVAVGMAGLETPTGLYTINDKQVNPVWHVPKSAWAGDLAGKSIPPGPSNPIKARWMGVTAGAGIHGTADDASLGSAASHGCIRMNVGDVIWLYDRVPYGSKVFIS